MNFVALSETIALWKDTAHAPEARLGGGNRPVRGVARSAWIMCAIIADIAILTELEPW